MAQTQGTVLLSPNSPSRAHPVERLALTPELIERFLDDLQEKGRTPETLDTYRRSLNLLYDYLPLEKQIHSDTLKEWRDDLLAEGYAPQTINGRVSAANSLLEYCGRRELQLGKPLRRTSVTTLIQRLCLDARVPEEKANPRCLKKLYQATQDNIQANISLLMEQAHDRLLETEQLAIGWKENAG